ncbi:MAG: DUF1805 domain-containing protein [Bdellovibrionaceae bacterium]|nr:DUF1805 domain-containing protein [Bdellovibrionales bacterium]MCB9253831.1 DUF1805 domain-containing protein [Pseudobdellovibrionaceae bacterium]
MTLNGYEKMRLDLAMPLLIIRGKRGFVSNPYMNASVCSRKTKEACAIVAGEIHSHHEMIEAKVIEVSDTARALGVRVGMTGGEALARFK